MFRNTLQTSINLDKQKNNHFFMESALVAGFVKVNKNPYLAIPTREKTACAPANEELPVKITKGNRPEMLVAVQML